jgi:hypothetical protein
VGEKVTKGKDIKAEAEFLVCKQGEKADFKDSGLVTI